MAASTGATKPRISRESTPFADETHAPDDLTTTMRQRDTRHEQRNCVRAFLGDGPTTADSLARLMEHFYLHDFLPLRDNVSTMQESLTNLNDTVREWRASLQTLLWVCAVIGGLISAGGTVLGIYIALHH